jgi:anaerobic selenocysteine-containing dehydrogenase
MHPADAADRGLKSGENVRVQSRAGSIVLPLTVTDEMMPGVVSIPHGWNTEQGGASINDVTDNQAIDALCGTAAFNGTPVLVEAEAAVAPVVSELVSQAVQ